MRCEHCRAQEALHRDGSPVLVHLFEHIHGYYCADCIRLLQRPAETELRRSIAERVPELTEEQLAAVPGQMLKFTLCLPIPRGATPGT
jgi:hypothetical protein